MATHYMAEEWLQNTCIHVKQCYIISGICHQIINCAVKAQALTAIFMYIGEETDSRGPWARTGHGPLVRQ